MAKLTSKPAVKPVEEKQPVVNPGINNFDKIKALSGDLNKRYGRKIMRTGDDIPKVYKVPFREPALDYVYDGGLSIGRFNELLGQEHTGKTRNSLKGLAQFQKYCFGCMTDNVLTAVWGIEDKTGTPFVKSCSCKNCKEPETKISLFVDIEGTTDPKFMSYFGIDVNGVIYVRVDMPSQAIDIVDAYLREPTMGLIVVDSVGAMGSDAEVEKSMEDIKMNQNALFLNRGIRKWQMAFNSNTNSTGKENGTTMAIINQSYQTLDLMSKDVAQGGRGLRHGKASSVKTNFITKNVDPKTGVVKGVHIRAVNEKNKTGIPYRKMEYYLNLDPDNKEMGYCQTNVNMQYVELAIKMEILEQRGAWFYYGTDKWNGKSAVVDGLSQEVKDAVDAKIYT